MIARVLSNKDAIYHELGILLRVLDSVSKVVRIKLGMWVVALNQTELMPAMRTY